MAALYLLAGVNHFISPDFYAKMIPDYIPYSRFLVYLSGGIEIILAIGVVLPNTKKIAAWGIVFMLIAIFNLLGLDLYKS